MLCTLEVTEDGRFASLYATPEMLQKVGADKADLDGMINLGRSIDTVEIAAMFRIESADVIKVSFRSRRRELSIPLCDTFRVTSLQCREAT